MDRRARTLADIDRVMVGHAPGSDDERDSAYVAAALAAVDRIAGPESSYGRSARATVYSGIEGRKLAAHGALVALRSDVEHGAMWTIPQLVHQEVFADMLAAGRHLLAAGFKGPAAVAAGCVLEQQLRELARGQGLELDAASGKPKKAALLNQELAKAAAYGLLAQKRVTAMLDLRNRAAHGQWGDFDERNVADLLRDVADFVERHPA